MLDAKDHVIFVQNRARRAGAQVSLSRLLSQPQIQASNPFVLLGSDGWLSSHLTKKTIPHLVKPWPSPRSLGSRMGGLSRYAKHTILELRQSDINPRVIVANDHQECLLALALSRAAGDIPVVGILRSAAMAERDFAKYQCNKCSALFARGQELSAKAHNWSGREVSCMLGSFTEDDLSPALPSMESFPGKILVAGSEIPGKGFADIIEAIKIVEQKEPDFPTTEFVFTGKQSESLSKLTPPGSSHSFTFVGRVEDFQTFARQFSLAIHPSRAETFGMAPLELILAGVPTMASTTGIIKSLPLSPPWIFPPKSPESLAKQLIELWKEWPNHTYDIPLLQQFILEHYHISKTAQALSESLNPFLNDG